MKAAIISVWRSPPLERARRALSRVVDALDRSLASDWLWFGAVTALLTLQLVLIFGHRPWLDEVQALLLARQSPTLADLLDNLRYEGHPPLWYLILRGLGAHVGPQWVLPVAAAVLALIAQGSILLKAPFSRGERILLASGTFLLFESFVVSRGASLGVCTVVLALLAWRSRASWLAIALLPLCDFLFGLISLAFIALKARERRLWWPGLALWLGCALFAAWSVRPAPDLVPAIPPKGWVLESLNFVLRIGGLLLPLQTDGLLPLWDGEPPLGLGLVFGAAFLVFAWHQSRHDGWHRALLFGFIGTTLVFNSFVYPLPIRHLMLIALLLIAFKWLAALNGRPLSQGMRIWLLAGSACGLLVAGINLLVPFDTGFLAAREIQRRGLTDRPWMAYPHSRGLGVGIHLLTGMEFERPERRCREGFIRWNQPTRLHSTQALAFYLRRESADRGSFYLLTTADPGTLPTDLAQPLARIAPGYDGVAYNLYLVNPGLPETSVPVPPCVAPKTVSGSALTNR
jgi:hypothetical protein